MRAIVVDDEALSLSILSEMIEESGKVQSLKSFSESLEAISWCVENKADVAFLDINMPGINGLDLAAVIQKMQPQIYIVFVTASEKHALDAFKLHAFDYLMKPVSPLDLEHVFQHIRVAAADMPKPVEPVKPSGVRFKANCFGNFDVFLDDSPIHFTYSKTKELLAYLVMRRGATCSVRELGDILYPEIDNPEHQQSRLRTLVADLTKTLKALEYEEVIYKTRGFLAIVPKYIECDYYQYLEKKLDITTIYSGEFMSQYEWAEYVNAYIEQTLSGK